VITRSLEQGQGPSNTFTSYIAERQTHIGPRSCTMTGLRHALPLVGSGAG